jgi:hypothetical protein
MHAGIVAIALAAAVAIVPAQADVAAERLGAAAAAFQEKRPEDGTAAWVEAWLAIDAVADGESKRDLSARATELEKSSGLALSAHLQFARAVVAGLEPALRQLLDAKCPSLAQVLVAGVPAVGVRRHADWIAAATAGLDQKGRDSDRLLVGTWTMTVAGNHGNLVATARKLLPGAPGVEAWLTQRVKLAPAAAKLAASSHASKWYRTAIRQANTAIEFGVDAADRERCQKILGASRVAQVEERYRTQAKVHMDAFRGNCRKLGESHLWDLDGSEWQTPWRGSQAIVISGQTITGDFAVEVDVELVVPGSRFQVVLAWIDGPPQPDYCAVEVELLSARQSAQVRVIHVQAGVSRVLAEKRVFVEEWRFDRVAADLTANRVTVSVRGEVVSADLPFARGPDLATRFGFVVPEQAGKMAGKVRDKDDVIGIRNLVVRRR